MDLVFNSEPRHGRHATQALSQRSDGCPGGSLGTDVASSDPGGAPRKTDFRDVLDAIFYLLTTGCAWSALPHDFPPEGTVRYYFHRWRRSGLWEHIHGTLRSLVRQQAGKEPQPSAGCIDSQTVKATRTSGARGYDAGKKNQRDQTALVG